MSEPTTVITNEQALEELQKGYSKAEAILQKPEKTEDLLIRMEKKLKSININGSNKLGEKLSHLPVFVSLLKSYVTKEYTKVPIGTIIAIISALGYFLSPVDLIPDFIPGVGHLDDAAVIAACFCLIETDIQEYLIWRDGKIE